MCYSQQSAWQPRPYASYTLLHPSMKLPHPAPSPESRIRWYDFRSRTQQPFLRPFQIIGIGLAGLLLLSSVIRHQEGNQALVHTLLILGGILLGLCLPGLLYYLHYFVRSRRTGLELDEENGFIRYVNAFEGQNLLFHAEQVDRCVLCLNLLLPYRVDTIILFLRGGHTIEVSSLVMDPLELIRRFGFRPEVYQRWLGPFNPCRWLMRGRPKNPG